MSVFPPRVLPKDALSACLRVSALYLLSSGLHNLQLYSVVEYVTQDNTTCCPLKAMAHSCCARSISHQPLGDPRTAEKHDFTFGALCWFVLNGLTASMSYMGTFLSVENIKAAIQVYDQATARRFQWYDTKSKRRKFRKSIKD